MRKKIIQKIWWGYNKSYPFVIRTALVTLGCSSVFLIGFLIQFILVNIFSDNVSIQSHLYVNAKNDFYFLKVFLEFILSSLFPALLFSLLIGFHSNKNWFLGIIYAMISLCIYDIASYLISGSDNIYVSIGLNFIGAPFAGVVCAYWSRICFLGNSIQDFLNKFIFLLIAFSFLLLFYIAIFFFFLFPIPQKVVLKFNTDQSFGMILKDQDFLSNMNLRENSYLEKYNKNFPYLKSLDVSVKADDFLVSSYGGTIGNPSIEIISDKKVKTKIIGLNGCKTIQDAIRKAQHSTKRYTDIDTKKIEFVGMRSFLRLSQKGNEEVTLFIPYERNIARVVSDNELELFSWAKFPAHIPLKKETYLYFQAAPDFEGFIDNNTFPDRPSDFKSVSLKANKLSFSLPVATEVSENCEILDFNAKQTNPNAPLLKMMSTSGFLIKIWAEEENEFNAIKVNIPPVTTVVIGKNKERLLGKDKDMKLVEFGGNNFIGELKVSHEKFSIEKEDLIIVGDDLNLAQEGKEIILKGIARMSIINGKQLSQSLFFKLDITYQMFFLTTLLAFISILIKKFRMQILSILNELVFGHRFPFSFLH